MPTSTPHPQEWQTIAHYLNPTEAHIVLLRLQAEGIPAQLVDNQMVQSYHLISVAMGGVRLQVPTARLAEAKQLLTAIAQGEFELPDDTEVGE